MSKQTKNGKFAKKKAPKAESPVKQTQNNGEETTSNTTRKIVIVIALAMVLCIAGVIYFLNTLNFSPVILPSKTIANGVTIAGVDVGGMEKQAAVDSVLAAVGNDYSEIPLVVTILDHKFEITPSISGAQLDIEGAVKTAFQSKANQAVDIVPFLALNNDAIVNLVNEIAKEFPTDGVTNAHKIIQETVDGKQQDILEITIGTEHYDFNADDLYDTIIEAYNNHSFSAIYECNEITAASVDLDALYAEHCTEAVEAVLDPETHEVTQSATGYRFDLDNAKNALAAAKPGDVLKFPFAEVLPEMDTETLKSMLFRDVLASYEAYQWSGDYRATNLRLACEALNGTLLYPGEEFSYNATLGERTPEKGYKPAPSYMGGETIDSYGGGICQPSSALYYCLLIADLEVTERHCHSYPSDYVPLGMDATVDWSGPDLRFVNNTPYPIRIDAVADGGSTIITLVGTETKDYYVEMEYEVWAVKYPSVVEKEVEEGSGHTDGEVKTSPYTGYDVQTYKLKYDKETDELISREEEDFSDYDKRDKVVYKVKKKPTEPTTNPSESTDPSGSTAPTEPVPPATDVPPTVTTPPATETPPTETAPPATEAPPAETAPPVVETETAPPETEPAAVTPPASE